MGEQERGDPRAAPFSSRESDVLPSPESGVAPTGGTEQRVSAEQVDSRLRDVAHVSTQTMEADAIAALQEHAPSFDLPKVGDLIGGRYELTKLLGTGGMGAVFAANHRGTGREVAVKVLLPSRLGQRLSRARVLRFIREAKAAGRIRHANVVDVYDVEGDAELPYIVMERLHGESLGQRVRRGCLSPEEGVRIVLAAMRGVSEAHRQGVIHRDLKPDNIFLAQGSDQSEPVPKVLDFGVSRVLSRDDADAKPTTLTRTGYVLGTPSYMPLEQLRGQADVDARADVYALGVILYEVLSGARPYEANNDHDLVIRMATEAPTPLPSRSASIDTSLAAIVAKALEREPGQRYPDVDSFAGALERWLAGERTAPQPAAPPPEPRAKLGARGWLLLILLLGMGAVATWVEWESSPPEVVTPPASTPRADAPPAEAKPTPTVAVPPEHPEPAKALPAPASPQDARLVPTVTRPLTRRAGPSKVKRSDAPQQLSQPANLGMPAAEDPTTKLKPEDF